MTAETREQILLIEDDEDLAERLVRILFEKGFRPTREAGRKPGVERAARDVPDAILLDLRIPSDAGRADADVKHGLGALQDLVALDPFRPIVVCSAHGGDKKLAREIYKLTRGGPFVFKDSETFEEDLFAAIAVALAQPAHRASSTWRDDAG
jgi:CheY-like chemotaxis protein